MLVTAILKKDKILVDNNDGTWTLIDFTGLDAASWDEVNAWLASQVTKGRGDRVHVLAQQLNEISREHLGVDFVLPEEENSLLAYDLAASVLSAIDDEKQTVNPWSEVLRIHGAKLSRPEYWEGLRDLAEH